MKQDALKKCMEVSENPYAYLKEWKEQNNGKIISCFAMYIPEEIIHASGMLPVIAFRSDEPVTLGHSHVAPYNCGLTRSVMDDFAKEKLDFLDGLVVHRMCLQAQGMPFLIKQNTKLPYQEYLSMPPLFEGKVFHDFLVEEMTRFKTGLEKFADKKITNDGLNKSIELYNKNRQLLEDIYEIRRQKPGAVKAREITAIVHSSMIMDIEENNKLLEDVKKELQLRESDPDADKKIRVMTCGSLCQTPNFELLDLIEELGMIIVDDDVFVGSRYFANQVAISADPIEELAQRYLKRTPPCPTKGDVEYDWTDYIIERAEKNNAKAIITLLIKYCPPHMCYYPDVKNKLAAKGIPEILIEVEHEVISMQQIKTRLQSFVEIIGGI